MRFGSDFRTVVSWSASNDIRQSADKMRRRRALFAPLAPMPLYCNRNSSLHHAEDFDAKPKSPFRNHSDTIDVAELCGRHDPSRVQPPVKQPASQTAALLHPLVFVYPRHADIRTSVNCHTAKNWSE
jgi:hypothetical protein